MIIMGIDPGASVSAVTTLRAYFNGAFGLNFLACEEVENELLPRYVQIAQFDVLGIERPSGYAYSGPAVVAALLDTAHAAGMARAAYEITRDVRQGLSEVPAPEWRRWIVGKPNASNAEVAVAVKARIPSWPKQSNNHERDAGGMAIYAAQVVALPILRKAAS